MANMDDRYFNLGLTLGQGIRARQAEKEARDVLANHLYPFEMVKERFINNNMTDEEFEQFLKDVGE